MKGNFLVKLTVIALPSLKNGYRAIDPQ